MVDYKSIFGYANGSAYRNSPYLDIQTKEGLIDMSNTSIPLYAQDETGYSKMLPPYSGMHKFRGKKVREIPMQRGGNPFTIKDAYNFLYSGDDEEVTAPTAEQIQPKQEMPVQLQDTEQEDMAMQIALADSPARRAEKWGNPYGNGNDNAQYAFQFFQNKGLAPHIAAGIVGNLMQESGNFRPDVIAGTKKGDSGLAMGIAQWHSDREKGLHQFAAANNINPYTLDTQLEYVYHEAKQRGDLDKMSSAKDSGDAAYQFAKYYERPAIIDPNRINYAKSLYPKQKGGLLDRYKIN